MDGPAVERGILFFMVSLSGDFSSLAADRGDRTDVLHVTKQNGVDMYIQDLEQFMPTAESAKTSRVQKIMLSEGVLRVGVIASKGILSFLEVSSTL